MIARKGRFQGQLRRVLLLIDALATQRYPKTIAEIHELVNNGTSQKTTERDVGILESLGLVVRTGTRPARSRDRSNGQPVVLYLLNRSRSQRIETVAAKMKELSSNAQSPVA